MANITLRQTAYTSSEPTDVISVANTPLTNNQIDQNFINLNEGLADKAPTESPTFTGSVTIPGGTINATTIGATTAAAGTFTNLNSNNVSLTGGTLTGVTINNSSIGITTPANGSFNILTVTGGTNSKINNTVIGDITPAAGSFSTLSSAGAALTGGTISGITINGSAIGGTTPAAGSFTTLTTSDAVTLSPAEKKVSLKPTGAAGTVEIFPGTLTGSIDNVTIGAANAKAGTFTNLTSTGTVSFTNALAIGSGGTGTNIAPSQGGIIYAASTTGYASTAQGTNGYVLVSGGSGAPSWQQTVPIANGGTGATTQQAALNAIAGTQTANRVLRSNGTNVTLSQVALSTDVSGTLPVANGGTGATTQQAALNAIAGGMTSGRYLRGDGTNVSLAQLNMGDVGGGTLSPTYGGTGITTTPTAGAIAYGNGTTFAFTAAGTAGHVLKSNGAGAPTWEDLVIQIVDETNNATRYLTFTDQTSQVENRLNITSTKFTVNPSTGELAATKFLGDGTSLFGVIRYTTRTANYTAAPYDYVLADTTSGAFTVTLPATPAENAIVKIFDYGEKFNVNSITVNRNGSTIEGQTENLILDRVNTETTFAYLGGSWRVFVAYIERNKVIGPILIGPTVANEFDTITINIKNYISTGFYTLTPSGGSAIQNGSVILWTLPSVTSTTQNFTLTVQHVAGVSGVSTTSDFIVNVNNIETAVDASLTITDFSNPDTSSNWTL